MYDTPTLMCDFYKISHREQYPEGTEYVYSTWTPRSNKHMPYVGYVVAFGMQAAIMKLYDMFDMFFFNQDKNLVIDDYRRVIKYCLGIDDPYTQHIEDLWDLGYLPLEFKAIDEGTRVPFRTPIMTVRNTDPKFFWLTNYVETFMSAECWQPATAATIADLYAYVLEAWGSMTCDNRDHVPFQAHDFSMRGMCGVDAAAASGAGHLTSFVGTDTIPAIGFLEEYYSADITRDLIGTSIPATEHSVMCAGGKDDEYETYRRLINDIYPSGFISIVSDTWDLWHVVTDTLVKLKDDIMARDGKVVIRPDSGDPVKIICGDPDAPENTPERAGLIELLWATFGGTYNSKGYKVLDPHIGAIYGDSITIDRCDRVCRELRKKGFASCNCVFGVGSYTYQYITRDTLGFAMKATAVVINGEEKPIFKDPATDDGTKKSNIGAVGVYEVDGEIITEDGQSMFSYSDNDLLKVVARDSDNNLNIQTIKDIRARLKGEM